MMRGIIPIRCMSAFLSWSLWERRPSVSSLPPLKRGELPGGTGGLSAFQRGEPPSAFGISPTSWGEKGSEGASPHNLLVADVEDVVVGHHEVVRTRHHRAVNDRVAHPG